MSRPEPTTRRRRPRLRTALTLLTVASALTLGACSTASTAAKTSSDTGGITVGTLHPPTSLDPASGTGGTDYPYLYLLFGRLMNFDPQTLATTPGLATSWKFVGADKLEFDLTLRQGVKFTDGTPFNADAVVYSLNRYNSTGVQTDLNDVTSVDATGPYTVALHLKAPYSALPSVLADRAGMIVSPTAAKSEGKSFGTQPVGAGPFTFVNEVADSKVTYKRNPSYYAADQIKASGMTFSIFSAATALVNALTTNQIDFALNIPGTDVPSIQSNKDITVKVGPSLQFNDVAFNGKLSPVNDKAVRQAFNYALDRQALNKVFTGGLGKPEFEPLPPGNPDYDSSPALQWQYDPAKAKSLLAAAGTPNVQMTCIQIPGLGYEEMGPIIVSEEAAVGIHITIQTMSGAQGLELFNERKTAPCLFVGWSGRPDPELTYRQNFSTTGFYNPGGTDNGIDGLLATMDNTYDANARADLFSQMDTALFDAAPYAPLMSVPDVVAYHSNVQNYVPNQQGKDDLSTLAVTGG
jgi:peptide/nickel transport system substrate-binding protein